jgi:hypothetical protein
VYAAKERRIEHIILRMSQNDGGPICAINTARFVPLTIDEINCHVWPKRLILARVASYSLVFQGENPGLLSVR